jgi:hypothetical protein
LISIKDIHPNDFLDRLVTESPSANALFAAILPIAACVIEPDNITQGSFEVFPARLSSFAQERIKQAISCLDSFDPRERAYYNPQ